MEKKREIDLEEDEEKEKEAEEVDEIEDIQENAKWAEDFVEITDDGRNFSIEELILSSDDRLQRLDDLVSEFPVEEEPERSEEENKKFYGEKKEELYNSGDNFYGQESSESREEVFYQPGKSKEEFYDFRDKDRLYEMQKKEVRDAQWYDTHSRDRVDWDAREKIKKI